MSSKWAFRSPCSSAFFRYRQRHVAALHLVQQQALPLRGKQGRRLRHAGCADGVQRMRGWRRGLRNGIQFAAFVEQLSAGNTSRQRPEAPARLFRLAAALAMQQTLLMERAEPFSDWSGRPARSHPPLCRCCSRCRAPGFGAGGPGGSVVQSAGGISRLLTNR